MDNFIPDMYQKSIYHIDYDKLKEDGIKCLLFDLDNTCVPFKDTEPNKKLIELFETLKDMDFRVIIFSNATKKRLLTLSDVVLIGDQLYTDILCGNKVGIKTILVNPMSKDDLLFTKIFRGLEKRKFKKFAKMGILKKGKYYE